MPLSIARAAITACLALPVVAAGAAEDEGWFPFHADSSAEPGVVGMADWLDAPAGKHGGVRVDGDHLVFADKTTALLWGVNNCNQLCAPAKDFADQRAAWYAKYGVNAVRQHKFMQTICEQDDATRIDAKNQDLFDYNFNALKAKGIYSGWSPIYYLVIKPGNRAKLLAADELEKHCGGATDGLVNFATDLQDLHIDLLTHLLEHVNPYTKLAYAKDPALAYVEIQNEDDIFWWSLEKKVKACPTYRALLCKRFCDWLRKRYGDEGKLLAAWGPHALDAFPEWAKDESLEKNTIMALVNPWFVGPDGLKIADNMGTRQRLLDTFHFLADTQDDYYARASKAIRATGYEGPIVGSPWQAAEGLSHYWNIACDQKVGVLDRHNYFGGGTPNGWQFAPCAFDDSAMLSAPGSGLLSSGLQQVAGRPFSLSEWDTQLPDQWLAEGAPLIAAYGMGLQGWSMSYQFAADGAGFTDTVQRVQPWGGATLWNTDVPLKIGLYPALARMLHRGDLKRGEVVASRTLTTDQLAEGKLPFVEQVKQQGDVKSIAGFVPPEALAVGRVELRFADKPEEPKPVDLSPYTNGTTLTSTTKQLAWDRAGRGCFTIDTPGTAAVVGFAPGREFALGQAKITTDTPFAVLFVTSLDRVKGIGQAKSLLITAVARAKNTGMRLDGAKLVDPGKAPMLLEGVRAHIALTRAGAATITALDHDGRRKGAATPIAGAIDLDGARDQAYCWVVDYP